MHSSFQLQQSQYLFMHQATMKQISKEQRKRKYWIPAQTKIEKVSN